MDTLIAEVAAVQESLHELRNEVDANLIYFKLEKNHFRDDRIQYVVKEIQKEMNKNVTSLVDLTELDNEASTSHELLNGHVSSPINSPPDFLFDLNNNDPNNNTEYELPQPVELVSAQTRQHEIREVLLREAKTIHCIVPNQSLEQIYSYLEANMDNERRVQIVMQEFLLMELPPESIFLPGKVPRQSNRINAECVVKGGLFRSPGSSYVSSNMSDQMVGLHTDQVPSDIDCRYTPAEKPAQVTSSLCVGELVELVHRPRLELGATVEEPVQEVPVPGTSTSLKEQLQTLSLPHTMTHMPVKPLQTVYGPSTTKHMLIEEPLQAIAVPHTKKHLPVEDAIQVKSFPGTSDQVQTILPIVNLCEDVQEPSATSVSNNAPFKDDVQVSHLNSTSHQQNNTFQVPVKHLRTLQEMFPDIDLDYLNSLNYGDDPHWLTNTITMLLDMGYPRHPFVEEAPPPPPSLSPNHIEKKVEMHYQNVLAVLPDADPTYLQQKVESMAGDEDAVKEFVAEALELKSYPTLADYLKRQEVVALQKRFTEQFSIEDFLEIFPDPFHYFTVEKKSRPESVSFAIWYLKSRYLKLRSADLTSCFNRNKQNLTLTCMELDKWKKFMKSKRCIQGFHAPTDTNIPFLQEVAFIENQQQIQDYIVAKKIAKEEAYKKAREAGELMECNCCYNDEVLMEDMRICSEGHLFCKDCVRSGAETQIGEGKTVFPCFVDCVGEFPLKTLQGLLKPAVFSRMLHRKQVEEVKAAGIPGLETCPFCEFATIPASEDKVFHCLNPDCMKDSCRLCREPNHVPLRCDEVELPAEVKMRTFIEDRMTEALVRKCWQCGARFIKEDGCNKMRCKCGANMCYVCREPVKDYSHFNGQGGQQFHKCPLFSDNVTLHVDAVKKEAKKAKKEVKSSNPNLQLKYDPTLVLPKAPTHVLPKTPTHIQPGAPMHVQPGALALQAAVMPQFYVPPLHRLVQMMANAHQRGRVRRAMKRPHGRMAVPPHGSPPPPPAQRRATDNTHGHTNIWPVKGKNPPAEK